MNAFESTSVAPACAFGKELVAEEEEEDAAGGDFFMTPE
jgi:hypothetical protein